MKNITLYLLILGYAASAQAMFQRFAVKPSLALCQEKTTDSNVAASSTNAITIESLDFTQHGDAVIQIFKESFPSTDIPDEFYPRTGKPKGLVLVDQGVVKGFMIISDEEPNIIKRLVFSIFGQNNVRAIKWLVVEPSSRNNNYGTLLWDHNEKDALEKAKNVLVLIPTSKAIPFYKKKGLYCVDEECIYMKKHLQTSSSCNISTESIEEQDIFHFFSA